MYQGQKYQQHYWGNKQYRELPLTFHIAGAHHYLDVIKEVSIGSVLKVDHEPTNEYDSNALRIITCDECLCGYVPKSYISTVQKYTNNDKYFLTVVSKNEKYVIVELNDLTSKYSM